MSVSVSCSGQLGSRQHGVESGPKTESSLVARFGRAAEKHVYNLGRSMGRRLIGLRGQSNVRYNAAHWSIFFVRKASSTSKPPSAPTLYTISRELLISTLRPSCESLPELRVTAAVQHAQSRHIGTMSRPSWGGPVH